MQTNSLKKRRMPSEEWNFKGDYCMRNGRLEDAIKCYERAIAIEPDDHEAFHEMANAYMRLGMLEEAVSAFKRCYQLNSEFTTALLNIGTALSSKAKHNEALHYYDQIISKGAGPYLQSALSNKGCSLAELARNEEALECFNSAIPINPKFYPPYRGKLTALSKLGKHEERLECIEVALKNIEEETSRLQMLTYKGESLYKLNKHVEALDVYELAIRTNTTCGDAYLGKAMVLEKLNRHEEADSYYKLAYSDASVLKNRQTEILLKQ